MGIFTGFRFFQLGENERKSSRNWGQNTLFILQPIQLGEMFKGKWGYLQALDSSNQEKMGENPAGIGDKTHYLFSSQSNQGEMFKGKNGYLQTLQLTIKENPTRIGMKHTIFLLQSNQGKIGRICRLLIKGQNTLLIFQPIQLEEMGIFTGFRCSQ